MRIRRVGMRVARWLMLMPVTVRALHSVRVVMAMIVMTIVVLVRMLMRQELMCVLVTMAFLALKSLQQRVPRSRNDPPMPSRTTRR